MSTVSQIQLQPQIERIFFFFFFYLEPYVCMQNVYEILQNVNNMLETNEME